jgi:predicted TPR repeat methyltransferase
MTSARGRRSSCRCSSDLLNGAILNARWATKRIEKSRFDLLVADKPMLYVGTFDKSFFVTVPLAPRVAFLAFNEEGTWTNVLRRGDERLAQGMNLAVADAEAYAYATDAKQDAFVRKYLPSS